MTAKIPQAIDDCHELILWLIPLLDQFPRKRRFTLGERLENRLLLTLEHLIEAAYSTDKFAALGKANLALEVCRHLWRMSWQLKCISTRRYEYGVGLMLDLGKQIGAWRRTQR